MTRLYHKNMENANSYCLISIDKKSLKVYIKT